MKRQLILLSYIPANHLMELNRQLESIIVELVGILEVDSSSTEVYQVYGHSLPIREQLASWVSFVLAQCTYNVQYCVLTVEFDRINFLKGLNSKGV